MKIVSLYGRGNIGKTTTLKKLLVKILRALSKNDAVLETSLKGATIDEKIADAFAHDANGNIADCYAVVKINGRKIGLTTYGDNEARCKKISKSLLTAICVFARLVLTAVRAILCTQKRERTTFIGTGKPM